MRRLDWKTALIEAVETRAYGVEQPVPVQGFEADTHSYLRVKTYGRLQNETSLRVKALTELGAGHWRMTPLLTAEGVIWINRGFIPSGLSDDEMFQPSGEVEITGLLRTSEPDGTVLERNKPAQNRWVSRDVAAMSEASGLSAAGPFFIDADHMGPVTAWPRGGLTILDFRNSHLSYALTWYALAALLAIAVLWRVKAQVFTQDSEDVA